MTQGELMVQRARLSNIPIGDAAHQTGEGEGNLREDQVVRFKG